MTKTTTVLELLRRKEGATIGDIAKAIGWQNHSIRGFISGTISKKLGLAVTPPGRTTRKTVAIRWTKRIIR